VHLDDDAVRAHRRPGNGEWPAEGPVARAVRRVHDDGQVRPLADDRHGRQVERVARGGLEGADAPLAEHDVGVARGEDVLGGHEPLLDGGREPALQEDGRAALPDGLEEDEVGHVPRADLEHVHVALEDLHVGRVGDLADDRQARLLARLGEQLQAFDTQALEGVRGRARLEGAPAQERGALALHPAGRGQELLTGLDGTGAGHDHERSTSTDLDPAPRHARAIGVVLGAGELVGLADADALLDAGHDLHVADALHADAHHAHHDALCAHHDVGLQALVGDGLADRVDLLLLRLGAHDDDHLGTTLVLRLVIPAARSP
jgi:hypothetical protein